MQRNHHFEHLYKVVKRCISESNKHIYIVLYNLISNKSFHKYYASDHQLEFKSHELGLGIF